MINVAEVYNFDSFSIKLLLSLILKKPLNAKEIHYIQGYIY